MALNFNNLVNPLLASQIVRQAQTNTADIPGVGRINLPQGAGNPMGDLVQPEEPVHDIGQVTRPEPRKGIFGVKGTLRDILGYVGDAFLMNAGQKAIYGPGRQQERVSDAIGTDFADNPEAAVQRLYEAGFADEAQEFQKNLIAQQIARQKAEAEAKYKGAQTSGQGYENLGHLFSAATPETFPALLEIAKRRAAGYGIDEGELPADYEASKTFGLDPYRRNRLEQFDEEGDLRERNVNDQISDRAARRGLTARGQDLTDRRTRDIAGQRDATTRRGQDMNDRRGRDIANQRTETQKGSASYKGKGAASIPKGTVQRNKKTGATRTWDGTKWVNGE